MHLSSLPERPTDFVRPLDEVRISLTDAEAGGTLIVRDGDHRQYLGCQAGEGEVVFTVSGAPGTHAAILRDACSITSRRKRSRGTLLPLSSPPFGHHMISSGFQ